MGQLNYSSSNSYMDALARHRRALGKPALTIQWGAWGEVGMATTLDEASKKRMLNSPMPPFNNKEGIQGLTQLLHSGMPYGSVYKVNGDAVLGMVHAEGNINWVYNSCFYQSVAPRSPLLSDLSPANAYNIWRTMVPKYTVGEGQLWKSIVKPR